MGQKCGRVLAPRDQKLGAYKPFFHFTLYVYESCM